MQENDPKEFSHEPSLRQLSSCSHSFTSEKSFVNATTAHLYRKDRVIVLATVYCTFQACLSSKAIITNTYFWIHLHHTCAVRWTWSIPTKTRIYMHMNTFHKSIAGQTVYVLCISNAWNIWIEYMVTFCAESTSISGQTVASIASVSASARWVVFTLVDAQSTFVNIYMVCTCTEHAISGIHKLVHEIKLHTQEWNDYRSRRKFH